MTRAIYHIDAQAVTVAYRLVCRQSIETPGAADDRQWLTFWLILSLLLFIERFLARVVLSTFPLYYEVKLAGLLWLLFWDGADKSCARCTSKHSAPEHSALALSPVALCRSSIASLASDWTRQSSH